MNPIVFALRNPVTVMVAVAAVMIGSALAMSRMRVDISPRSTSRSFTSASRTAA